MQNPFKKNEQEPTQSDFFAQLQNKSKKDKEKKSLEQQLKDSYQDIQQRNSGKSYAELERYKQYHNDLSKLPEFVPIKDPYQIENQSSITSFFNQPNNPHKIQQNLDLSSKNEKDHEQNNEQNVKQYSRHYSKYQQNSYKKQKVDLQFEEYPKQDIIKCYNPEKTKKYSLPSPLSHIKFPYIPYDFQTQSIQKLTQALQSNTKTILFESPTGSGKTQTILTSIFSYLKKQKVDDEKQKTKVLYFTRTVSQMNQIVAECQKSQYSAQSMIYTTQPRLCIHPKAQKLDRGKKKQFCNKLLKENKCPFYKQQSVQILNGKMKNEQYNIDIEDLLLIGKQEKVCPYFFSRAYATNCQTLILSYQYIINPLFRESIESYLNNCIIVFDEAHNLDKVLEEAYSWFIDFEKLMQHNIQIKRMSELIQDIIMYENQVLDQSLKATFCYYSMIFEDILKQRQIMIDKGLVDQILDGKQIIQFLQLEKFNDIQLTCMINYLKKEKEQELQDFVEKLQKFIELYIDDYECFDHLKMVIDSQYNINIICCSPQVGFQQIFNTQPQKIILSSGTLSPFDYFKKIFNYQFENIIQAQIPQDILQKTVKVIQMSTLFHYNKNQQIEFNYQNRSNQDTFTGIYKMLLNMNYPQKGGVLIFLPSYSVLEQFKNHQQKFKTNLANFYFEQKSGDLEKKFQSFQQSCKVKKCIFFMVFNGKFSEGVDFKQELARLVIILGIPYANYKDKSVEAKKFYLQEKKDISFHTWYKRSTFIKINQALGRVKRNLKDFGAIMLIDKRYSQKQFQQELQKPLRSLITKYDTFEKMDEDLRNFYCQNLKAQQDDESQDDEQDINENNQIKNLKSWTQPKQVNQNQTIEHQQEQTFQSLKQENQGLIDCVICYTQQQKHNFQKAKCGHIICQQCWQSLLQQKLECPMCKIKVRPKNLRFIKENVN